MNIVISFQKIGSGSYEMASLKIAKFLAKEFNAKIIDCPEKAIDFISSKIIPENIFIVSGMWQFCKFRELAETICKFSSEHRSKIFFCCNDYKTTFPSSLKKNISGEVIFLSNGNYGKNNILINWKALTFTKEITTNRSAVILPKLIYYGSYREGREEGFTRFFNRSKFPVYISTSEQNYIKFKVHGNINYEPDKNISNLSKKYDFTVYMSDKINHSKMFVFPANRFYECLSFGLFQFIDRKTILSFQKDFNLKDLEYFLVENSDEVAEKIKILPLLKEKQRKIFREGKKYFDELKSEVHRIVGL